MFRAVELAVLGEFVEHEQHVMLACATRHALHGANRGVKNEPQPFGMGDC